MRNITMLMVLATLIPLLQACAPAAVTGAAATTAIVKGDRRNTATVMADQAIELKINDAIYSDRDLGTRVHVNATSYNRVLLLTGEVPDETSRDQVEALARNIEGIKKIYNELEIAESSSLESRTNDSWITYSVKGWLLRKSNLKASDIKVVTERSTVYLMGLVTEEEADIAADVVRRVEGVDRVVKAFEYPGEAAAGASTAQKEAAPQKTTMPEASPATEAVETVPMQESDLGATTSGTGEELLPAGDELILEEIPMPAE